MEAALQTCIEAVLRDRKMAVMTHIGDPQIWYDTKYADTAKYGTRDDHYQMWENVSHFLMMEKPREFNAALTVFLQQNQLLD